MVAMLPRLFFVHFRDTSLVAEKDGQLLGFLAGVLSPALRQEASIYNQDRSCPLQQLCYS